RGWAPARGGLGGGAGRGLIRPGAGGAPERQARMLDEPLSLDRVVRAVSSADTGGVVTFTGLVRRRNQGREVERLEYEAYREMAEKVLRQLCDEIEAELPGTRLAVEHRTGARSEEHTSELQSRENLVCR